MNQQLSFHCHAYNKLSSNHVVFGVSLKKKGSTDMGEGGKGAFGPPPLTRTKKTKISHFWLFIFLPPPLPPHTPHPIPTKNNLVQPLEKAQFPIWFKGL